MTPNDLQTNLPFNLRTPDYQQGFADGCLVAAEKFERELKEMIVKLKEANATQGFSVTITNS